MSMKYIDTQNQVAMLPSQALLLQPLADTVGENALLASFPI